jgi:hypothetical protein
MIENGGAIVRWWEMQAYSYRSDGIASINISFSTNQTQGRKLSDWWKRNQNTKARTCGLFQDEFKQ